VNVHFTYTDERFFFIGERFFNRWDPMGLNQGARCWDRRQTRLSRPFKIPRSSGAAPISRLAAPLFFSFSWTWGSAENGLRLHPLAIFRLQLE